MPTKWNILKLHELSLDKDALYSFLFASQALASSRKCPRCSKEMVLSPDKKTWRCGKWTLSNNRKKKCEATVSANHDSWFSRSRLKHRDILMMTHMALHNYTNAQIELELELASHTICDWKNFIREVLVEWALSKSEVLGGEGKTIEIDESKFGKRKYHRGHHVEGTWVFGGVERESGKVFLVPVEDRKAETLVNIIKQWIAPGSTIISDCWAAYNTLGDEGYTHLRVNHSLHFKDPATGAHTNSIESTWRHVKATLPEYNQRKKFFAGYLAQYMFMKKLKSQKVVDPLEEFFAFVSKLSFDSIPGTTENSTD